MLRTTDDVISYLNNKNLPGILLAIDFTKAFDTIAKKLIIDSLTEFRFGPTFIQWIQALISQTESSINHYGWLSEPFSVQRGIRQGCPLSPLLFVLAVELLAIKIRSEKTIKGITIRANSNNVTIKIQQFADDTTLYLCDLEDLENTLRQFHNFANISGLKISVTKSEVMWLGQNKHRDDKPFNLKWVKQTKILGIIFKSDKPANEIEENWLGKIDNIKRIMQQWARRNLSIYGKILIAKTFLISQFIYIMQSIGLPEHVLHTINRLLYTFIWKKKTSNKKAFEKVKRKVLTQDHDKGGLKMIDMKTLQTALYFSWIPKLTSVDEEKWKIFPVLFCSQLGEGLHIFNTQCHRNKLKGLSGESNYFWKHVLETWLRIKEKDWASEGIPDLNLNSSLWNNKDLQYKSQNLHMKDWIAAGIFRIKNIIDENHRFISLNSLEDKIGTSATRQFEYNAVKTAFENARTRGLIKFHSDNEPDITHLTLDSKPIHVYSVKDIRNFLSTETQPCASNFWRHKLQVELGEEHWSLPFLATKETRLQVLQWKILHNIYPTNILLKKMGIADSERCDACDTGDKDYVEHFFYSCPKIKHIWKLVQDKIAEKVSKRIEIDQNTAILGYVNALATRKQKHQINHLITIAKLCISKFRYGTKYKIDLIWEKELLLRSKLI